MQTQWNSTRKAAVGILVAIAVYLPAVAFAAEKSFERTLSVNGAVTMRVSTGSGSIRVSQGSDNQVHIAGRVKSNNNWWSGSSDDAVAKVADNPPINQAGNIIRIGDNNDGDTRHVSIDYVITTPANTMLVAESGSGDLQLMNLLGTVKAHTGSGSIQADKLGAGSRLDTGSGSIDAKNLMGSTSLETGSGEISAQLSSPGDVIANTGSGSIRLADIQGSIKAETGSGSIDISGKPIAPWKLETGSGSISLQLGNAQFTLDAETGSGSVKTDLPLTSRVSDKHHISGTVNGGGPMIKAETGSGDIQIR